MAKRKDDKSRRSKTKIDKKLRAIYDKSRREFSAADSGERSERGVESTSCTLTAPIS
jgi:hypothetical protein